jgi:hypothetical protein
MPVSGKHNVVREMPVNQPPVVGGAHLVTERLSLIGM